LDLNPNLPANAATTGDNNLDNVEQVSIPNPTTGTYLVQVTHKGNLVDNTGTVSSQNLSIYACQAIFRNRRPCPKLPPLARLDRLEHRRVEMGDGCWPNLSRATPMAISRRTNWN